MTGLIYLIGGGEVRDGETRDIDDELKSLAPAGSTFVFLNFAAQDSPGYAEVITSAFGDKFEVVVPTEHKGREYAIEALESASVIYLGGGDADNLMRVVAKWDLLEHLTAALKRGAHIAGMSAGAQALSSWYVREENDTFELREGWGIVPVCVQVHAQQASIDTTKSQWDASTDASKYSFIAIGECAAWRVGTSDQRQVGAGTIWKVDNTKK